MPSGFTLVRYGPGESVPSAQPTAGGLPVTTQLAVKPRATRAAQPGDFLLTHSTGLYGILIRFGEGLRYWGKDAIYAHWSHAAIFADDHGNIIEALGGGVQKRNVTVYKDTEYVVVHLPDDTGTTDREQAVEFARHCLHDSYGWLTILSIGITLITGSGINFSIDGQQICSALVARCIERIGEIFTENEPWHLMPADLAKHFDVRLVGEKGKAPSKDAGSPAYSRPGRRKRRE